MNEQPDALQIAGWIEASLTNVWHQDAADELRRLHAANVELMEAIEELTHSLDRDELLHDDQRSAFDKACAASAKHGANPEQELDKAQANYEFFMSCVEDKKS